MRKCRQRRRKPWEAHGFTMIELLMTMLFLTFVLLALAALQIQTIRQVTYSQRSNEATKLAQRVMEHYQAMTFANIVPTGGNFIKQIGPNGEWMHNVGPDGVPEGPFSVWTLIENVPGGRMVTVRVTWLTQSRGTSEDEDATYHEMDVTLTSVRPAPPSGP